MIVRMFAEWCSPNPDNLVLVRLIPAWLGSVWGFQWFLALIWSGLEMIFNIDISICFNVNDSSELYNAKIVWKRFFAWKPEFLTYFTENGGFSRKRADFCSNIPPESGQTVWTSYSPIMFLFGKESINQGIFRKKMMF